MTIDDLTRTTGEWLRGVGPLADVVISSRIRLARNLSRYPFLSTASVSDKTAIYRAIVDEIPSVSATDDDGFFVDVEQAEELDRQVLVERHLISKQHAAGEGPRGVSIASDETSSLMINEEDHLRIQGLRSGLQLDTIWDEVNEVDDTLAQRLDFAYDKRLGFLTACPTNVGTGIRVSVMLHLPALKLTREIEKVSRAAHDLRLAVRGLHGEGTEALGDLYQLSNQTTLGKSENEIIAAFGTIVIPRIVEYEREARATLAREKPYELDDRIWRAFGILNNARTIGSEETLALLSPIRMGIHVGRFNRTDINTVNELFLLTQPAHLQKISGRLLDGSARAVARAERIRDLLATDRS